MEAYDATVAAKPHVVVLTKSDLLPPDAQPPTVAAPHARGVVAISSVAHRGLDELKEELWKLLMQSEESPPDDAVPLP